MSYFGLYGGLVEDNRDPQKLGRVKVRVPLVYGITGGSFGTVATNDLPWALPKGLPSGQTEDSGGADWLPDIGDSVWVQFLDGEPEKPVWEWAMQTQSAAQSFLLHDYETDSKGAVIGLKRGAWTRYGHTVEWNEDGLILTTKQGYGVLITDASEAGNDGDIAIRTQAGQTLDFDDATGDLLLNVNNDWNINVAGQILGVADRASLTTQNHEIEFISGDKLTIQTDTNLEGTVGQDWMMEVEGETKFTLTKDWTVNALGDVDFTSTADTNLTATGNMALSATGSFGLSGKGTMSISADASMSMQFLSLALGQGASSPFVLGDLLLAYLNQLYTILVSHTHEGVMSGPSATGPMVPQAPPPPPSMLSQTIKGR